MLEACNGIPRGQFTGKGSAHEYSMTHCSSSGWGVGVWAFHCHCVGTCDESPPPVHSWPNVALLDKWACYITGSIMLAAREWAVPDWIPPTFLASLICLPQIQVRPWNLSAIESQFQKRHTKCVVCASSHSLNVSYFICWCFILADSGIATESQTRFAVSMDSHVLYVGWPPANDMPLKYQIQHPMLPSIQYSPTPSPERQLTL